MMGVVRKLSVSFALAVGVQADSPNTAMRLHMMTDQGLSGRGAVCLDGTDAGFYFAPASDPKNANDWQIYFTGGGWCYDEMDCWGRSNGALGSSKSWQKTSSMGGLLSDNCDVNPDFCNFNRVQLMYCDGNSFAGDREEPLVVTGLDGKQKPLYFRGKRIIDAVLDTLMGMGLKTAENVLLTGCSAGGLATFLHTDYVRKYLVSAGVPMKKFKSAPISGFFLLHPNVEGKQVYPEQMRKVFEMSNATAGVNSRCAAALKGEDAWKCNFAQLAYAFTDAPIFPLNSALDSWQTGCIYTSELAPGFPHQNSTDNGVCKAVPGYQACVDNLEKCTSGQMADMNRYIEDFNSIMQGSGTFHKSGNGAFIHSCSTHCEAQQDGAWTNFKAGGISMQKAFSKWWNADGLEAASAHTYGDCLYHTATSPHRCNPSCGGGAEDEEGELESLII